MESYEGQLIEIMVLAPDYFIILELGTGEK